MPYFLKHFFDPYFDHKKLKPAENKDGSVDHYDLSYVQNVYANQVLAEWLEIDEEEVHQYDPSFVFPEKNVQVGPNCLVNPDNPEQIIATANGYVFYDQDKITVKTVLNVRGDVDFHTGNIHFAGDMIVHEKVNSGFSIKARDIRVKGVVEGAQIKAAGSLLVEQGVKGQDSALLRTEKKMRLRFAEKATLQAKSHILIEESCLHCDTYANGSVAVKEKLIGGSCFARDQIYVGSQLGGGISTRTSLILGKNPFWILKSEKLEKKILELGKQIEELKASAQSSQESKDILYKRIESKERKYQLLTKKLGSIWDKMNMPQDSKSRVIVPGEVRPGVQIWIGSAQLRNEDYLEDVCFYFEDGQIKTQSPAPRL